MYKSKSYATSFDALAHTKYVCVLHSFASYTHTHTCTDCVQHNKDAKHKEERGGGEGKQESWVTATSGGDALATLSLIGTRPA